MNKTKPARSGRFTISCIANYNMRVKKNMDATELASIINKPSARFLFIWSIIIKQKSKSFGFPGPCAMLFPLHVVLNTVTAEAIIIILFVFRTDSFIVVIQFRTWDIEVLTRHVHWPDPVLQ